MYQVALIGYKDTSGVTVNLPGPYTFYEPGFNILFPLEFSVGNVTEANFHIRRRSDSTGTIFDDLNGTSFVSTVRDVTTGESVTVVSYTFAAIPAADYASSLMTITINDGSYPQTASPRIIECNFNNSSFTGFGIFRLYVDINNRGFNYILVDADQVETRSSSSVYAISTIVDMSESDNPYMILSPYNIIDEVDKSSSDFSYPVGSFYYRRRTIFSNEPYDFTVNDMSDDTLDGLLSLFVVPNYHQAACLLIDTNMKTQAPQFSTMPWVDIRATGKQSESIDDFRVYFTA